MSANPHSKAQVFSCACPSIWLDPCRLVRQVNSSAASRRCSCIVDPCRLVRQVKEFVGLGCSGSLNCFTCRTSRQGSGRSSGGLSSYRTVSPAGRAGRGRGEAGQRPDIIIIRSHNRDPLGERELNALPWRVAAKRLSVNQCSRAIVGTLRWSAPVRRG
jgi:hypothetical protein